MKIHNSVLEISSLYEGFLVDIWGVLHSSGIPFDGIFTSLESLKKQGKKIVLLSNAPRRAVNVSEFLSQKVGVLKGIHYDEILTSGEAFFLEMQDKAKGEEIFYIGPAKDLGVINGLNLRLKTDFNCNPAFAILTGMVANVEENLEFLKKKNLTLYCLNPDVFITNSQGLTEECAGFFAKKYEQIGGKVIYFGKPFLEVYTMALSFFSFGKSQILAIGDGMETDILGANNAKIDCALCLAGLPSIEMKRGIKLEDFLSQFHSKPNFIIKSL